MYMRLLILPVFGWGGCDSKETDVYVGTYGEFLRNGELNDGTVRLDDPTSHLTFRLFRGETWNLCGEVFFDGDVQIFSFDIWDAGGDPYPINKLDLNLNKETVDGKIDIPDFVKNAKFKGDFIENFEYLELNVDLLGKIVLDRIERVYEDEAAENRDDDDRPVECR